MSATAHRHPFDAHLCAQGPQAAEDWAAGFAEGAWWAEHIAHPGIMQVAYELVRDSSPSDGSGLDWSRAPVVYDPWGEGWMLGVYGHVALGRQAAR